MKELYKSYFKSQNPCFDEILRCCQDLAFLPEKCIVTELLFSTNLWTNEGWYCLRTRKRKVFRILTCISYRSVMSTFMFLMYLWLLKRDVKLSWLQCRFFCLFFSISALKQGHWSQPCQFIWHYHSIQSDFLWWRPFV